jgi:hypothetical protein
MAKKKRVKGSAKNPPGIEGQAPSDESRVEQEPKGRTWVPPVVFALLSLLIYIDVLFNSSLAPAAPKSDLAYQFLAWRQFGFGQMASGNLPLWNPHIFSGTPYLASFQSALFYPPNGLHLFLPLGLAISWTYALHTFLMGLIMSLWARYRGAGLAGQILAGVIMMFSGPFFLHGFAGHLPHLAAMAWAPLIFLATDALADGKGRVWILVGAGAVALQILAGHPQYVYYTGLMVGAYALLRARKANLRNLLPGLFASYLLGAALAAIQLVPGLEASAENIRTSGLPYDMAAGLSLAPVQGLTALAPYIFGHHGAIPLFGIKLSPAYLGLGYLWEMCIFVGIAGLAMAGLGFSGLRREQKIAVGAMLALTMVLAMGRHTPVHQVLYRCLPYFSSFRVPAKFAFFTTMFLALLAAEGVRVLGQGERHRALKVVERVLWVGSGVLLLLLLLAAFSGALASAIGSWLEGSGDHFVVKAGDYAKPEVQADLRRTILIALAVATPTMLIAAFLVHWRKRSPRATLALVAFSVFEMLLFAACGRASMLAKVEYPQEYDKSGVDREKHLRTLHLGTATNLGLLNSALARGTHDMWGYDPGVLQRYGQLMAASQQADPEKATQTLWFKTQEPFDGLYRMFRLKWVCLPKPDMRVYFEPRPLEQVELIGRYELASDRATMFSKLLDPSFDPKAVVLLENEPVIAPAGTPVQGEAKVVWQDSDTLEIRAQTDRPALLLVTDNYAKGWRAEAMADSSQLEYQLMTGNYTLRAVPLHAGKHHLRMVYRPTGWVVGCWVSALALLAMAGLLWVLRIRRKAAA